jgi:ribose 1,5-bisphosphokinase PhnN
MKFLTRHLALPDNPGDDPAGFQPLTALPIIIIVGLTGAGKSTLVNHLANLLTFELLPNRRAVTDEIIIRSLQRVDGAPETLETDRLQRFEYTARYRQANPGGMAHALSLLVADNALANRRIVFDGLRGLDEVSHATRLFPSARFVVLDAPDVVRLGRLLDRGDAFDTAPTGTSPAATQSVLAALHSVARIETVLSSVQLSQLAAEAERAGWLPDEAAGKAAIIVKERLNYDSLAARDFLRQNLPPGQVCVIDTATTAPDSAAATVKQWIEEYG